MGDLPDIRPVLAQAEVVVVPLEVGSGSRIKLLTAFAMARCVVASPTAAAGLPCANRRELLIAERHELASAIELALGDAQPRARLGASARAFAERFTWREIGKVAVGVACGLVDRGTP